MKYPKFDVLDFNKAEVVNVDGEGVCVKFSYGESFITAWTSSTTEELRDMGDWNKEVLQVKEDAVWELTNDTSEDIEQPEDMKFIFNHHSQHINDCLYEMAFEA